VQVPSFLVGMSTCSQMKSLEAAKRSQSLVEPSSWHALGERAPQRSSVDPVPQKVAHVRRRGERRQSSGAPHASHANSVFCSDAVSPTPLSTGGIVHLSSSWRMMGSQVHDFLVVRQGPRPTVPRVTGVALGEEDRHDLTRIARGGGRGRRRARRQGTKRPVARRRSNRRGRSHAPQRTANASNGPSTRITDQGAISRFSRQSRPQPALQPIRRVC